MAPQFSCVILYYINMWPHVSTRLFKYLKSKTAFRNVIYGVRLRSQYWFLYNT